ncbi:MAG: DUF6111 family protein [Hyphomicrobium sp.]|nr:DUF6111 family protein [Hyphomicrobium sp.]
MIRIVIENLLLFLLPTVAYVGWLLITRPDHLERDENGRIKTSMLLKDAPFFWLIAAGTVLLVATVIAFGTSSGGKPGQTYSPPVYKDGRIEPGHIE